MFLTAVRHEVNNLESSVVLQELELAINFALYVFLWSLGNSIVLCTKLTVAYIVQT